MVFLYRQDRGEETPESEIQAWFIYKNTKAWSIYRNIQAWSIYIGMIVLKKLLKVKFRHGLFIRIPRHGLFIEILEENPVFARGNLFLVKVEKC